MSEENSFPELIRRVRAGDEDAAAELVRRYEPAVRSFVRVRLVGNRLGRVFDSTDICQSVLASFFVRAAVGQYDLESPRQLVNLLVTMARNKIADKARHEPAGAGETRRVDERGLASAEPSPSQQASLRELLDKFRRHLSAEECRLADLRAEGRSWAEIAAEVGGHPDALRMQLARAADRAAAALHLEEARRE